jgi:nicotinamide mononucleotide transporter
MPTNWIATTCGIALSVTLLAASGYEGLPFELSSLEAVAVVASAWCVWLLAKNQLLGWWIGLIGVVAYAFVFYRVRLYAEVGIQVFYFFTSLQAIYIWLRGGVNHTERPVGRISTNWMLVTAVLVVVGTWALRLILIELRGAAPFWDALTTVLSLAAHIYLMGRFLESWYLWIVVDIIFVPLYASRGLYVTSALYGVFLLMAIWGLRNFWILARQQLLVAEPST